MEVLAAVMLCVLLWFGASVVAWSRKRAAMIPVSRFASEARNVRLTSN